MALKKTDTIYLYVLSQSICTILSEVLFLPIRIAIVFFFFVIIILIGMTTEFWKNRKDKAYCDIPIQAVTILERNKPYIVVLMEEITKVIVDGSTSCAFDIRFLSKQKKSTASVN